MKLSKSYTTVTPLSKTIALILFVAMPFIGFYLGMQYQKFLDLIEAPVVQLEMMPSPHATPTEN